MRVSQGDIHWSILSVSHFGALVSTFHSPTCEVSFVVHVFFVFFYETIDHHGLLTNEGLTEKMSFWGGSLLNVCQRMKVVD